jgi:hypothetical protein
MLCGRHVGLLDRRRDLLPDRDLPRYLAMVQIIMIATGIVIGLGAYGLIMLGQFIAEKLM